MHFAHELVVVDVEFLDGILIRTVFPAFGRRVPLLEIAPEHVLDPVRGVENANQGPLAHPVPGVEEHGPAFFVDIVACSRKVFSSIKPSSRAQVSSANPSVA